MKLSMPRKRPVHNNNNSREPKDAEDVLLNTQTKMAEVPYQTCGGGVVWYTKLTLTHQRRRNLTKRQKTMVDKHARAFDTAKQRIDFRLKENQQKMFVATQLV